MFRSNRTDVRGWLGMLAAALLISPVGSAAGEGKPEEKRAAPAAQAGSDQEKAPVAWGPFQVRGFVETGYRWRTGAGSEDMYRSQINLGRGPRLSSSHLVMEAPPGEGRLWDRLVLDMNSWGGDPYNTVRLRIEKAELYHLEYSYQNIQYFHSIPSFANPLLGQGLQVSQHRMDSGRHLTEARLTLWPTALVHLYVGFSKSRGQGAIRTTYAAAGDEFVLGGLTRSDSNAYRVGVEFGRSTFGGFVEQSFQDFKDDWRLDDLPDLREGNSDRPLLGRPVFLEDLLRNDHVRGDASVSRAFLRWVPLSSLQLSGHATYLNSDHEYAQDQTARGSFVSFADRRRYPASSDLVASRAQLPGLLAGGTILFRPTARISIVETFHLHQMHSAGSGAGQRTLFQSVPLAGSATPETVSFLEPLDSRISFNTRRNTVDGTIRLHAAMSLRLGYRFQRQEARLLPRETPFGPQPERVRSNQHVPLVGLEFRVAEGLQFTAELEKGYTDRVYYRTLPRHFTRLRVRARSEPASWVRLSGHLNLFDHRQGLEGVDHTAHNRGFGFSVHLAPAPRLSFTLEYERSDADSNLRTVIPQLLAPSRSLYVENGNYGSFQADIGLPRGAALWLGYSVLGTTGSFPLNFHQPYAGLSVPLVERVSWICNWRYYGYNQKGARLEDYRTHLYSTGLAFRF